MSSTPRMLVRRSERGERESGQHPWTEGPPFSGFRLGVLGGLDRVAVNLIEIAPGGTASPYHLHRREEEWLYVLSGTGVALVDDVEHPVGEGDFLGFPPGSAHSIHATGEGPLELLVGGERITDADVAEFPRLHRRMAITADGPFVYQVGTEVPFVPARERVVPPGKRLLTTADRAAPVDYQHPHNPRSRVKLTALSRPTGLKRVAVVHCEVPAGGDAYAFHVHQHDEEWLYVLAGTGTVEIGEQLHPVGPGDFVAFPPRGPAHDTHAGEGGLTYLAGGDAWTRSSVEIVDFPRLGLRQTMVGTRSLMTFPLAAAMDPRRPG